MTERTDHLTDEEITRFLLTRSADAELGLLDDIVRTVGATPQDRPWLGLRPILLPRRIQLIVPIALLLATMGAIGVGSVLLQPAVPDSGGMWPQSRLEEVREAQELADAGDPRYTWQVDPQLAAQDDPGDAEIFARFLREELGWEEFVYSPVGVGGLAYEAGEGTYDGVVYLRCSPGRTNPLYPDDPTAGRCAPTIDEFRYETVSISLAQLVRKDRSGIWVVTQWNSLPALQQVAPPTDAEATGLLEAFLQARVDGEGAEEYLDSLSAAEDVPLLYATNAGTPYERFEFELVDGPEWPTGRLGFEVRLFADGGETVVEQSFGLDREAGRLGLGYEPVRPDDLPTTENGKAVPEPFEFLGGEVTFAAAPPWDWYIGGWGFTPTMTTLQFDDPDQGAGIFQLLAVVADPLPVETGCEDGRAPADAEALARSIRSDPDLEATEPVAVSVGGIVALRMDVVAATGASVCQGAGRTQVVAPKPSAGPNGDLEWVGVGLDQRHRMRLYLLDLPEGMSARILAIAIFAPEQDFERVMEAAAQVLDTLEFHAENDDRVDGRRGAG